MSEALDGNCVVVSLLREKREQEHPFFGRERVKLHLSGTTVKGLGWSVNLYTQLFLVFLPFSVYYLCHKTGTGPFFHTFGSVDKIGRF